MNFCSAIFVLLAAAATGGDAFSVSQTLPRGAAPVAHSSIGRTAAKTTAFVVSPASCRSTSFTLHASRDTTFDGEPTERARSTIDHRQVIRTLPVTSLNGDEENIFQWSQRLPDLQKDNLQLVLVSIGVPEKAQQLMDHLDCFDAPQELFFVDPENALYDALDLNRGVQRTFFNINTPYAFLKRIQQPDGLQDIGYVLSRWSKALFIPPKQSQALLQGGTFVFSGDRTVYAHYDPSTAAHADLDQVIQLARECRGSTNNENTQDAKERSTLSS